MAARLGEETAVAFTEARPIGPPPPRRLTRRKLAFITAAVLVPVLAAGIVAWATRKKPHVLPFPHTLFGQMPHWSAERLYAFLEEYPEETVAYIWVALAFRCQKRYAECWAVIEEMDRRFPNHHFPRAMRQHYAKIGLPPPPTPSP